MFSCTTISTGRREKRVAADVIDVCMCVEDVRHGFVRDGPHEIQDPLAVAFALGVDQHHAAGPDEHGSIAVVAAGNDVQIVRDPLDGKVGGLPRQAPDADHASGNDRSHQDQAAHRQILFRVERVNRIDATRPDGGH